MKSGILIAGMASIDKQLTFILYKNRSISFGSDIAFMCDGWPVYRIIFGQYLYRIICYVRIGLTDL